MPLTTQQLKDRANYIGASDLPAICGVDPFRSAWDVWAEKTGKVDIVERKPQVWQTRGHYLEKALLAWAADYLAELIHHDIERMTSSFGFPLVTHRDGEVVKTENPIECKSTGAFSKETWGAEGTDQIPDRVITQCIGLMVTTKSDVCHVPVYLPEREFQMFLVQMDKNLLAEIMGMACEFWNHNVKQDIPPENTAPSEATIKRLRREPEKVVSVDAGLVSAWLDAKETRLAAEKAEAASKAALFAKIGDAEAADCSLGRITYFPQIRTAIDTKRLTEEEPDIAAKYMSETSYRVARFKKMKG